MIAKLIAILALAIAAGTMAQAGEPKRGAILHIYHRETPPSLSIHEEATFSVNVPAMGLFNNLVIYDQHKPQNSMGDIVPELATSWAWDSVGTTLTFKLREGITWHDGKPFTAKDVKCTFDLLQDKAQDKFRKNPRRDLFNNISEVTTNGDFEVALHLKRRQPPGHDRLRLHTDVSLSSHSGADAHPSDRHRSVQVRGIQAERVDQTCQERKLTSVRSTWVVSMPADCLRTWSKSPGAAVNVIPDNDVRVLLEAINNGRGGSHTGGEILHLSDNGFDT